MRPVAISLLLLASACSMPGSAPSVEPPSGPAGIAVGVDLPEVSAVDDGFPAPDFGDGLDWVNTDPLALADLRGKVVLLDFWTHGCINCIQVIPDLQRLQEEFGDDLVVIGVHSPKYAAEARTESVRNVAIRLGLGHPIVNDTDLAIWQAYAVRAWPTVYLIDRQGHIVGRHEGEGVYEVVQPHLERLVGTPRPDAVPLVLSPAAKPATVLSFPTAVAVDPVGERLHVADAGHHQIVSLDRLTGDVVAVYGSGRRGHSDGPASGASFDRPNGMAVSPDGATLYVADTGSHTIRAIDLEGGGVSTIAGTGEKGPWPPVGGVATDVGLHSPWSVTVVDGRLFVAMAGSHQIWVLDLATGIIGPYAGSGIESVEGGPRLSAALAQPSGLTTDGSSIWFADAESSSVRLLADGEVSLVAGADDGLFTFGHLDGIGRHSRFQHPLGVAWDGGVLWVADTYNAAVRRIDLATGSVSTVAGGAPGWADGSDARFDEPGGLTVWGGLVYVADTNNHSVRVLDPSDGSVTTLVPKGIERFRHATHVVDVPGVVLSAGAATLIFDLDLPAGYKVNPDAPGSLSWGGDVGLFAQPVHESLAPSFPLAFELDVIAPGVITGDLGLVYCEEEREAICLFERVRFEVPVAVSAAGGSEVRIGHTIRLPAGIGDVGR
jgi:DNA-binding beta-propeller fold protein YncE